MLAEDPKKPRSLFLDVLNTTQYSIFSKINAFSAKDFSHLYLQLLQASLGV